jgi:type I restriction enzyme, S subunit
MNLLEKNFDIAFAAHDGIKKLRELILTLAMQGKLVPQDPKDQPASQMLQAIKTAKAKLVEEGKFKSLESEPTSNVTDTTPFQVPQNWTWCSLDDISAIARGGSPRPIKSYLTDDSNGLNWIKIGDSDRGKIFINDTREKIRPEGLKSTRMVFPGDLILSNSMSFGYPYILNIQGCIHDGWLLIRTPEKLVNKLFIYYLFLSGYAREAFTKAAAGAVVQNLNADKVRHLLIPLPPLNEQRRIVAKIDELMARCDELEKLKGDRSHRLTTVHTTALNRLLIAKESSDFSTAWNFITQHFGELYSVKENVAELRKVILQLAVMGKLVPQDPTDEPASELLKAIMVEKQRLVKEGKIKPPKLSPDIKLEEMPYELPKGWEWVRLGEISLFSDSGWSPQCLSEPRTGQEWGVLKVSAVSWGEFRPEENKALPPGVEAKPECEIRVGDFLISRANTEELVARSVIVKISPIHLMMSDKIVRFNLSQKVEKDFINLANLSRFSREYYARNASGTSSSMKNISREVMNSLPISIPPLAEQNRIVAKIDQLMGLCDRLEQQIDNATSKQNALLNAVMTKL